jgi:hypothetical protein
MRFEIRTLLRTISALAIVLMLLVGASADALAHGRKGKQRKQNQGRHLGWERGRRVGHQRRDDNNWSWRRRQFRRNRRDDRRDFRRQRRSLFFNSRRDLNTQWRGDRRQAWAQQQRFQRAQFRRSRRF